MRGRFQDVVQIDALMLNLKHATRMHASASHHISQGTLILPVGVTRNCSLTRIARHTLQKLLTSSLRMVYHREHRRICRRRCW